MNLAIMDKATGETISRGDYTIVECCDGSGFNESTNQPCIRCPECRPDPDAELGDAGA